MGGGEFRILLCGHLEPELIILHQHRVNALALVKFLSYEMYGALTHSVCTSCLRGLSLNSLFLCSVTK